MVSRPHILSSFTTSYWSFRPPWSYDNAQCWLKYVCLGCWACIAGDICCSRVSIILLILTPHPTHFNFLTDHSWVVGLALLADTVPQQRLGQSLGYVGAGMSIGILVAPLLGGVVFDRGGYNAVFGMAYALVGIDIILRIALVEKKVAARWLPATEEPNGSAVRNSSDEASNAESSTQQTDPDPEKAISASHTAAGGSKEITEEGSQAAETTTPIETQEAPINTPSRKRVRSRLPPVISLLYSRRLLSALFGALIQAALVTAFDSVLTIRAAQIFDWSSTGAALLFLPIVIPTFTAPAIGWLMDRIGPRYPAALGFLVALPPFVCLRYVRENTLRDKVLLCVLLALIGLSLTFTFPPLMAEIAGVVEAKEKKMLANGEKGWGKGGAYAQAYGLFNMAFAGGCLVGPLLAGFVVEQSGWATMGWVLGLLSAVTFVPTLLWMGGWIGEKR